MPPKSRAKAKAAKAATTVGSQFKPEAIAANHDQVLTPIAQKKSHGLTSSLGAPSTQDIVIGKVTKSYAENTPGIVEGHAPEDDEHCL